MATMHRAESYAPCLILKFGLIGASYVAASRMVPAFQANDITPKALFDTDQERFQFWRNHDLDLLTTDLDELLGSDVDAVYISSRNDQHAAHAVAAARAGKHPRREADGAHSC
jgi:1,5-anhydro-D-fructose reductase (1,5-anhydro-D-mannitol-forming)